MNRKLGVFGDSFATISSQFKGESWIEVIQKITAWETNCYGRAGTSAWYSYLQFMKYHETFTDIIFCQTSPHRVSSMPHGLEQYSHLKTESAINNRTTISDDNKKILIENLLRHNPETNFFISQQVFNEVNEICKRKNINLITILPFQCYNDKIDTDAHIQTCVYNLAKVAEHESAIAGDKFVEKMLTGNSPDLRQCHLTQENNYIFGSFLIDRLCNNKREIVDVYKTLKFVYKKEFTLRYDL